MVKKMIRILADVAKDIDPYKFYMCLKNKGWRVYKATEVDKVFMIKEDCKVKIITDTKHEQYVEDTISAMTTVCLTERISYDMLLDDINKQESEVK